MVKSGKKGRILSQKLKYNIPSSVNLGDVRMIGSNFSFGEYTYFNSGHIATNSLAKVSIGRWCAIGHNVTILAVTHETGIPTGDEILRPSKQGDVIIEDGVWIGSNVIITPGITIGRQAVIGGNAVVAKDIPPYAVCSGIPCRVLYFKKEDDVEAHNKLMV
jgi:maltose O-acetyltransferase